MKAYLMYKDKNAEITGKGAYNGEVTLRDIEMETILKAMSGKDEVIYSVVKSSLLSPLSEKEEVLYRHDVLKDALANQETVRYLYAICSETEEKIKKYLFGLRSSNLRNTYFTSLDYMSVYLLGLKEFRVVSDKEAKKFKSLGFTSLFEMFEKELSDEYLKKTEALITELKDNDGMIIRARFGKSLAGCDYTLCRITTKFSSLKWLTTPTYKLKDNDETGKKDFEHRKDLAINQAANALGQSAEHLSQFFTMLRSELAFYIGILNYKDLMENAGMPVCIPEITEENTRTWENLYDSALVLRKGKKVDANTCTAKNKSLFIVTGANQGGKTTFLRSIGQSQLMGQAGMLTGASSLSIPLHSAVFTHFKKEEDKKIKSGKLDEELSRMSGIIDHMNGSSLILFNESFASTNEREGSLINKNIVDALISHGHEVFTVTHLYTFSSGYLKDPKAEFLIAERGESGERTHRILEGLPEKTAYGEDIYKKIYNE